MLYEAKVQSLPDPGCVREGCREWNVLVEIIADLQ